MNRAFADETANFRAFWSGFGALRDRAYGGELVFSGIPGAMYNQVLRIDEGADPAAVLAEARHRFAALPWLWHVGPDSAAGTATRLEVLGGNHHGTLTMMTVDLNDVVTPSIDVPVRELRGTDGLSDWVRAYAPCLNAPSEVVGSWYRRPDLNDRLIRFEVRDGDIPVATAALLVAAGLAGIYTVTTAPGHRHRGLGSAVTLAALAAGRRLGLRAGVLQATPAGAHLYRRLGFQSTGEYQQYAFTG